MKKITALAGYLLVTFLGLNQVMGQVCGGETVTPTDWCPDGFAVFEITAGLDADARYHWYEPDFSGGGSNPVLIDRFYGDNDKGTKYVSATRYNDAGSGNQPRY